MKVIHYLQAKYRQRYPTVNADVKLTRVAEVKLTHLGEDGGFGTAYVDPGAVRGDSGVVSAG